jgi:hypothetical protein
VVGKKYNELFYETNVADINAPKNGIVVDSKNLDRELANIITSLGLIGVEKEEFLDWWLPRLKALNAPYILFSIIDTPEKERIDKVNISPKPDTFIEFMAYFKPLDGPISIPALNLPNTPPERVGFTAVEWGGVLDTQN